MHSITKGFGCKTKLVADLQGGWRVEVGLAIDPFSIGINGAFTFRRRRVFGSSTWNVSRGPSTVRIVTMPLNPRPSTSPADADADGSIVTSLGTPVSGVDFARRNVASTASQSGNAAGGLDATTGCGQSALGRTRTLLYHDQPADDRGDARPGEADLHRGAATALHRDPAMEAAMSKGSLRVAAREFSSFDRSWSIIVGSELSG